MKKLSYILLVDDDNTSNLITRIMLEKANVVEQIQICLNGEEASRFLMRDTEHFPDLILLDINMPLMNGLEFLEYWHKNALTGKSKIVMYTSSICEEEITQARQYDDVIEYLEKPLSSQKINLLIDTYYSRVSFV